MAEQLSEKAAPGSPWGNWDSRLGGIGLGLWIAFNAAIVILVWRDPDAHSVVGNYRGASAGWWAGSDIYGAGVDGFLYLPSFAVLFTPFALLGAQWGDMLWRLVSVGTLTFAVWRAIEAYLPAQRFSAFGRALLLILPAASAAIRNGQATTILTALMLLAALAIAERRWWRAAILLALGFAIKPLGIVLVLLATALYRPLRLPIGVCVLLALVLPLSHPHPTAAWHVYGLGIAKLFASSLPGRETWSDISGLLEHAGLSLTPMSLTILRLISAVLTLWVARMALRRQNGRIAAFDLFALAVCYLMLMNPRTEENTYIMLAVVLALFAVMLRWKDGAGFRIWLLVAFCVGLGCHAYGTWIFRPTEFWLKPLICLGFLPILLEACLGRLLYRSDLSADPDAVSSVI